MGKKENGRADRREGAVGGEGVASAAQEKTS